MLPYGFHWDFNEIREIKWEPMEINSIDDSSSLLLVSIFSFLLSF